MPDYSGGMGGHSTVAQALKRIRQASDELHGLLVEEQGTLRRAVRRVPLQVLRNVPDRDRGEAAPPRFLCHLVLQGGGMHGAAHAGFLAGLEHAGVRFAGVAGASAGAIVAMALVCARGERPLDAVAYQLTDLVRSVPADTFIDGTFYARRLIKRFLLERNVLAPWRWPDLWRSYRRVLQVRGLNPGSAFENWLALRLRQDFQIPSVSVLSQKIQKSHLELGKLTDHALPDSARLLQLMTASLPMGIKLTLPDDLRIFDINPSRHSPAILVRASMAIPIFFEPVSWPLNKIAWQATLRDRLEHFVTIGGRKAAEELTSLYMIDGGVFSNLPLYAFADSDNALPTLTVSLIQDPPQARHKRFRSGAALLKEAALLFGAIKAQRDRDTFAAFQNTANAGVLHLASIDVTGISWLNFMATSSDLDELYRRGVVAAAELFEWWTDERCLRKWGVSNAQTKRSA